MMKKTLIMASLLVASMAMQAADYSYLNIKLTDNTVKQFDANGLVLTFADDYLTVTSGSKTTSIAQNTLASMYFTNNVSGINDAISPVSLRLNGRTMTLSAPAGSQVQVVSMGGMLIDHYTASAYAQTTTLRPGIYIVKIDDRTTKIHVK